MNLVSWENAVETLRSDPANSDLVAACYYDDPLVDAAERFRGSDEFAAVLRLLDREPGTLLEIGAGRGIASYAFAKSGWRVTAVEPDTSAVVGSGAIRGLFEAASLPIEIVETAGENLPLPNDSFDVVYGRAVFHHADQLETFCAEAARVLKPGGLFVMTREHVISKSDDLDAFLQAHPLHHLYGGEAAYRLDEYLAAIKSGGLSPRDVIGPHSSIINYFPQSPAEHRENLLASLAGSSGRLATRLSRILVRIPAFRHSLEKKADSLSHAPGRLYTFLATKS